MTEKDLLWDGLPLDLDLVGELGRRVAREQALRSAAMSELPPATRQAVDRRLAEVDADNTRWLQQLLRQRGWPGRSVVGDNGAQAVWLLAQHADADPGFQAECVGLLAAAVAAGEADRSTLAYLDDRVRLARGEPQRYGTQCEQGEDRQWRPLPLAAPEDVDRLRAEAGLEPLADYLARIEDH